MQQLATVTVVGLLVIAAMVVMFIKVRQKDLIAEFMQKRRAASKLVCRADYVEGVEKIPVALSLTETTLFYENPDMEASFDLDRLDEIEYAQDLSTGRSHDTNHEVLRLRSHGATFEFLLEKADYSKWMAALPPRRMGDRAQAV
jgi:hypothetical protein